MANNNTLRIAMISEHGDPLAPLGGQQSGGQNVYVYELARALSKKGIKVDVFTRWENRKSDTVVRFGGRAKVIRLKAGPRHFISKDKFRPLMPEFVEHFLEYVRTNKVKYDIIHTHYYFSAWAGMQLKNILKIPLVVTFHSLGIPKKKAMSKCDLSPTERTTIETQVMKEADLIIATSPQEIISIKKDYNVKNANVIVVPPGVNLRRFILLDKVGARNKLNIKTSNMVIVFAGKMERRKGGLVLVEAIKYIRVHYPALYDNLRVFMFSGDPRKARTKEEQEANIRHEIKDKIVEGQVGDVIQLMPGVPQDKLHYYYGAADIVTMPSYYEPFGMVAIEAMATGTPVVASNVGGLKFIIRDGFNGYHCKPKDYKSLAIKIIKILKNPDIEKKMSKNAHIFVNNHYGWVSIADQILNIYNRLSNSNKGSK